jgi:hypothetical protein
LVTNAYGLHLSSNTTTGTNRYGAYFGNVSGGTLNYAVYTNAGRVHFGDDVDLTDGKNISTGTGSGLKLGTAANQKLGFFNATPVVQQTGGALTATATYSANEQAMLNKLWTALRNLGLIN